MWYVIIFAVTLLLDQLTKALIDANNVKISVIEQIGLYITNSKNTGASFSFLADKEWAQTFFIILTAVVLIGVAFYLCVTKADGKWHNVAITFILSGTVGNFIDRISFGYVRDFIDVRWFANFNVADSFLCIGTFMLIVYILFLDEEAIFKPKAKK